MRDIEDQTILVTGSTDGIGMRTARDLASMGARVLLHGRNPDKGREVLDGIASTTANRTLEYYNGDFASLDEVRSLAERIAGDHPRLDVLINNAGIGTGRGGEGPREESADGLELRFQVNYLAPFLLTHLLLPCLERGAPSRIVNVSSLGQASIDLDDPMLERGYDAWTAYGRSKLAVAMFTCELAERLEGRGITVNALHPGSLLDTKMVREAFSRGRGDPQRGADAEVYLATSPEVKGTTGRFFDQERPSRARPQAYDRSARKRLWELSLDLTGLSDRVALPA